MTRAFRRFIARLGIAALLFMQLAVAAHACPGDSGAPNPLMVMNDVAEAMGDCPMLDHAAANLCKQHCQQDSQAIGDSAPSLPPMADLPLLAVVPAVASPVPVAPELPLEFLAHSTAPPPSIRFGVFRS